MAFVNNQTRTKSTIKKYMARAHQILLTIPESYMANPDAGLHPLETAKYCRDRAPDLRSSSLRSYKAALICYMQVMAEQYPESSDDYLAGAKAIWDIPNTLAASTTSLPKRTSSGKVKLVRLDDLHRLSLAMVPTGTSDWQPRAFYWLVAGIASGLRPAEWESADIIEQSEDRGLVIRLANAKNTNGRASGEFREIIVEPGWMAEYTLRHIAGVKEWLEEGRPFAAYYDESRVALYRSIRKLWPKDTHRHYSLYSGRHQFCANVKRVGHNKKIVAKMMGHASTRTAEAHYGRRINGHTSFASKIPMPALKSPTSSPTQGV